MKRLHRRRQWCRGKVRFPDRLCAVACRRAVRRWHQDAPALRVYACPLCSGYHLTSQVLGVKR